MSSVTPSAQKSSTFEKLPFDIVDYVVNEIVDDELSLKTLSQTCRELREIALPRLSSHTLVISVDDASDEPDPLYELLDDFIHERNNRKPRLIKTLEIRDCIKSPTVGVGILGLFGEIHQQSYQAHKRKSRIFEKVLELLPKCTGLRKVLRDGYDGPETNSIEFVKHLLELPNLKIFCLKIHQDHEWRYEETPIFEEYERYRCVDDANEPKGLACLSIALPMRLDRPYWDDMWVLCRSILRSNIQTLKHLYVDGPDLEVILEGLPAHSLSDLRLETLLFRMFYAYERLREALGLTIPVSKSDIQAREEQGISDAATSLRRIEFHDMLQGSPHEFTAVSLLQYMWTPHVKQCQIYGYSPRSDLRIRMLEYVQNFKGLEKVEFLTDSSAQFVRDILPHLSSKAGHNLQTLKFREEVSPFLIPAFISRNLEFPWLRRLELYKFRVAPYPFTDLDDFLKVYPTVKEIQVTLDGRSRGIRADSEDPVCRWTRRTISSMYATAFFLQNLDNPNELEKSYDYPEVDGELYFSTKVVTPQRNGFWQYLLELDGESSKNQDLTSNKSGGQSEDALLLQKLSEEIAKMRTHKVRQIQQEAVEKYAREVYHTPRLPGERSIQTKPYNPMHRINTDAGSLWMFIVDMPANLELFQITYMQQVDPDSPIVRDTDAWRKTDGIWVYERELKPLPMV